MSKKSFKIAFYLAGHMRSFCDYIKQNLQEFIKDYDVDIFVATHTTQNASIYKNPDGTFFYPDGSIQISLQYIKNLLQGLPVKRLLVFPDKMNLQCVKCRTNDAKYGIPSSEHKHKENPYIPTHCFMCKTAEMTEFENHSCVGMWRNVWRCHTMAKEYEKKYNFKYKYYVRSRPDLVYIERLHFEKLPPLNNKLITGYGGTLGYPDDQFALGEEEIMDHYCDLSKVLENWLVHHDVVRFTLDKYELYGHLNTGLVRMECKQEPAKIIIEVEKDNKWLCFYDRQQFNMPGILYK